MDYDSGNVIYEYNGHIGRSPASMTKVMSLYCIYRELERQNIPLSTIVPLSKNVLSLPVRTNYQCIPLYENMSYTVDELIGAVATYSASNALLALVELVAENEQEFVKLMNLTAEELGLNARYYDSCGGYTNLITPVCMAQLARRIITDFPDFIDRTSKKYIDFHGTKYYSTNKLYTSYPYEGADGLKTGTSTSAGYCFCGTAVRDGRRLITVTMCSESNESRFKDTINLMDFGFKDALQGSMYSTDITTYINGFKIPTLLYRDKVLSVPVIIAEDLSFYGFDVSFDEKTHTVTARYNPNKECKPIENQMLNDSKNSLEVYPRNGASVVIVCDGKTHILNNVYRLNGYLAISMDEIASLFSYSWDSEHRIGYITK